MYLYLRNHLTVIVANHFLLTGGYRDIEKVRFNIAEYFPMSPDEPLYYKLIEEFNRLGIKQGADYTISDYHNYVGFYEFTAKSVKVVYVANRLLETTPNLTCDEFFRIELEKPYRFYSDTELFIRLLETLNENGYIEGIDYTYIAKELHPLLTDRTT